MTKKSLHKYLLPIGLLIIVASCTPTLAPLAEKKEMPNSFSTHLDTLNSSAISWNAFFKDPQLVSLIETALQKNQELQITLQEIEIARNEVRIRKGAILPSVGIGAGAGIEKVGKYTSQGAGDASAEITPGRIVPEDLKDFKVAAYANWEVDIWKKLRNSKKAAVQRFLSTVEGKNFVITNLVAEIASSYYELLALDGQLEVVRQNIQLQSNAFEIVKNQKQAARATELAVQKFQAEVLASKGMEFSILQQIKETENKINFLVGQFPQEIKRAKSSFVQQTPFLIHEGVPSQLLNNRPDIKQAELQLEAAKLDVKVARAEFYPSFGISATMGVNAFKPNYLFTFPESLLYAFSADLVAPLINRNALKAEYSSANARQIQALYNYEKTVLTAVLEVSNQLSKMDNVQKSFDLKLQEVNALNKSISVATDLFQSARVDYFEVLMTQRDALESQLELIETKKEQFSSSIALYKAIGGGWR